MGEKRRLEYIWQLHPNTERYSVGAGFVGGKNFIAKKDGVVKVRKGDNVLINGAFTKFGSIGWSDRIGWTEKIVTQDMIGQKIAIFTGVEDKSLTDKISLDQLIFLLNVRLAGGIAKVYRECVDLSLDDIMKLPRRKDKSKDSKEAIINRLFRRIK